MSSHNSKPKYISGLDLVTIILSHDALDFKLKVEQSSSGNSYKLDDIDVNTRNKTITFS